MSEFDAGALASAGDVTPSAGFVPPAIFAAQNESNDAGLVTYGANQPVLRLSRTAGSASLESALTGSSYFSITLTPTAPLSFTSLTFNAARGGASANRGLAVFSNVAGFDVGSASSFTQSDALLYVEHLPEQRTFEPASAFFAVDLSGAAFQNVATPATFYFYTFTPGDGSSLEIDNIVFNQVPEPSVLLLGGMSLLALLRRRPLQR